MMQELYFLGTHWKEFIDLLL
uniref:Uncharacterized protein n=1 Tax=Anguilla anguilla TaxID=7936 RepID=A0A0E9VF69_ANGAN